MKKLILPTDFSLNAEKALHFAVQIAKQAKAEIFLVHACVLLKTNKLSIKSITRQ
jgi:nucleotide-binding universal stress UspA family protein